MLVRIRASLRCFITAGHKRLPWADTAQQTGGYQNSQCMPRAFPERDHWHLRYHSSVTAWLIVNQHAETGRGADSLAMEFLPFGILGALVGGAMVWLALRARGAMLNSQFLLLKDELIAAKTQLLGQQETNVQLREKIAALGKTLELNAKANEDNLERMREVFGSLCG